MLQYIFIICQIQYKSIKKIEVAINKLPKGQRKYCSKQCKWNRDKRVQRAKEEGKEYLIEKKRNQ